MKKWKIVFLSLLMCFVLGQVWASAVPDRTKLSYVHLHPIPQPVCSWEESSQELKLDFAQTFFQAKLTFLEVPIRIPRVAIPTREERPEKILVKVEEVLQGSVPSEQFYLHYFNTIDTAQKAESSYRDLVGLSFYVLGQKAEGKVHAYPLSGYQILASNMGLCY